MSAKPKSVREKTQNVLLKEREKNLKVLRIVGILQSVLLLVSISVTVFCILRFVGVILPFEATDKNSNEKAIWMAASFVQCLNMMAIVLYWIGLCTSKVELLYGYIIVNAVWAVVSLVVIIVGNFLDSTDETSTILLVATIAGIAFCMVNAATVVTVIVIILKLRSSGKLLSASTGRTVQPLSNKDAIVQKPMGFNAKKGVKDSITERTLRFVESVHK